jgi:hypothetical protein
MFPHVLKNRNRSTAIVAFAIAVSSIAGMTTLAPTALGQDPNFQGTPATNGVYPENATATFPLIFCWYNGQVVYYIRIDTSDQTTAQQQGLNTALTLENALSSQPRSYDDIYTFTNFTQYNVIPSVPTPVGYQSTDPNYSPLWQVSNVSWNSGSKPRTLTSEADILQAQSNGEVTVTKTNVVINCPVIFTPQGGKLPNVKITLGGKDGQNKQ